MSHTIREKQKLINRVRRIKGQVEAIERALMRRAFLEEVPYARYERKRKRGHQR